MQPYLRAADPDWIVIQETFWAGTFEGLPASHLAPLALTLYWKNVTFLKGGPQLTSLIQKTLRYSRGPSTLLCNISVYIKKYG